MINAQNSKWVLLTPPAALIDGASATVAELDTNGWDYAEIMVIIGDTEAALTALLVTEADVSATSHATVTGLVYGTSADIVGTTSVLPTITDDDSIYGFEIDLRKRKRFLDMTVTVASTSTGAYVTILARLTRGGESPETVAAKGLAGCVRV